MAETRFAMALPRRPISANKQNPGLFVQTIKAAARQHWPRTVLDGPTWIRVVWFHRSAVRQDVDNILKRVIDGLKTVVYEDDSTAVRCLAARVHMTPLLALPSDALESPAYDQLSRLLADRPQHILYIEVGLVSDQRQFSMGAFL